MRSDSKNADKKFRMHAVTRRCGKNGCRPCEIFYAADIIEAESWRIFRNILSELIEKREKKILIHI